MIKLTEVEHAIAQAAYPDVHPDFTDAGWERMAKAAISALQNPTPQMLNAAAEVRKHAGLLSSQGCSASEFDAMLNVILNSV